jgi:hypothetical protein
MHPHIAETPTQARPEKGTGFRASKGWPGEFSVSDAYLRWKVGSAGKAWMSASAMRITWSATASASCSYASFGV